MIILYGNSFSSPSNKTRYLANALGIDWEYRHVDLMKGENKTESYLKLHPAGKVPALQDGDFSMFESNAILRYLAGKSASSLYPQDLEARARVDEWLDFASLHVGTAMGRVFINHFAHSFLNLEQDPRSLADGRQFLGKFLPVVEKQLRENAYLAGLELSLADIGMLAHLDPAEVSGIDLKPYPSLLAWRKNLQFQDFYQKCHSSYGEMLQGLLNRASA